MRKNLLKTLLVIIGMVIGINGALAETDNAIVKMTYVDYSNPDEAFGEIPKEGTAQSGYNKISGESVNFANTGWGVNYITYIQVDASAIDGTITGATLTCEVSGSTDSKRVTTWGLGYNASEWSDKLTYNTADKTITLIGETQTTSTKSSTTFETISFDISDAIVGNEDKKVTIIIYETAAGGGYIKNPLVEITSVSANKSAEYTIKYLLKSTEAMAPDIEVKESTTGVGEIGQIYTVTDKDKESCFFNDIKYIYEWDKSEEQIIAADGSTVITLLFREAEKYSYIIKSNFGTIIKESEDFEGETLNIVFPRHLEKDGTLYSKERNTSGGYFQHSFTLNENNQVETINYTKEEDGVVFLSEAEDIESLTVSSAANSDIRCSNGLCAYNAGEDDALITTLPAGKYKLSTSVWGNAGSEFIFKAGEEQIYSISSAGYVVNGSSEEFALYSETPITLGATGNGRGIDFVYIIKTGDITEVPIALSTEYDFSTYCNANFALDFTDNTDVKAFAATVDEENNRVVLTEVMQVAAGEGVVLKNVGNVASATVNVIATAAPIAGNAMVGVTKDMTAEELVADHAYVLTNNNTFKRVGANATNLYAAGKAYLRYIPAAGSEARPTIVIDDSMTAVASVTAPTSECENAIYNLQGVRVQSIAAPGLYIVNGKTVVVK